MKRTTRRARRRSPPAKELRKRLQLAEDTLLAIRRGEVDALVVAGATGDSVVTLAGAELPYKVMFDQMYEGAVTLTADGTIVYCNRRFSDIVGLPFARVVGSPLQRFVPVGDRGTLAGLWREAATRNAWAELSFRTSGGALVPVSVSLAPLQLGNSALPLGVIGLVADISAQRQAAERLRESEERLRLMVENVRDYGLYLLDPAGHVISWNTGAERINGYRAEEILGQHLSRFYSPREVQRGKPRRELVLAAAKGQVEDEGWQLGKGGTRFWAHVVTTALRDQAGKLRGFARLTRDITERKRAEQLRARLTRELMQAQDSERRRIAQELHDETGQSLTGLLVGLRNIERCESTNEAAELAQQLRAVAAESLSNVRRLARGLHPRILDDLGLRAAVTLYVDDFEQLHGITAERHLGPHLNRLPLVVQTTVYRVLQEALTNVARHAGARKASIRLVRNEETVQLRVEDDGTGITRRNARRTGPSGRRGLGLGGMQERVALLGGSVRVESEPGAGTVVTASIPLKELPWPGSADRVPKPRRARGRAGA